MKTASRLIIRQIWFYLSIFNMEHLPINSDIENVISGFFEGCAFFSPCVDFGLRGILVN